MRNTLLIAATAALANATPYELSTDNHTCVLEPAYRSCSAKANSASVDSCCVEKYGGLVLLTQFWDVYADKPLPENTFTLHGLWPDYCNGSYGQYCDKDFSRQYDPIPSPNTTNGLPNGTVVPPYTGPNIGTFLEPFGKFDLLAWMNKYWISQSGPNADFWAHEFSKHATCFSTFDVPCYGPEYRKHEEVVDFFETAIGYYKKYPTWEWLAKHSILPRNSTGYSKARLENALTAEHGAVPYVGCSGPRYNETEAGRAANSTDSGRTVLSEIWYYMHVYGRPQEHNYVPVDQTSKSGCTNATNGVWYYEPTKSARHYEL
ncbi:Putative ribonuclease T2 [Septoria linicola]|uniref:ribonuclease T2 n=1 Tax=Septoria linicola TaxID=215465 RepID=A0A9Q9AN91_9PEZI|nr:putative ribonuclease T2 [Septoria linicola]USW51249.1 Putative ribonuclease T2 [Septoria linicola]